MLQLVIGMLDILKLLLKCGDFLVGVLLKTCQLVGSLLLQLFDLVFKLAQLLLQVLFVLDNREVLALKLVEFCLTLLDHFVGFLQLGVVAILIGLVALVEPLTHFNLFFFNG